MSKIKKNGIALAVAIVAIALAFPAQALITNADVANNAGISYSKLSLTKKITSKDIKNGTIKSKDIDDEAIEEDNLADDAVTSDKIEDGAIVAADLAAGTLTAATLADGSVTSAKILDETIASADILDGAIVAADIATGGVATAEILDGTILTGDISADTILAADIATGAVETTEILDSTILTGDISADTILAADIATGAVATAEILDDTILTGDISDGTITAADLAADSVAASELADDSVASANIMTDTIAANDINSDAVGASELADDSVASENIIADTIVAADIATSAVATAEILDGTIAAADLATDLAITTTGASALNGGITVDTTNFIVNGTTGAVTSASTITGTGIYASSGAFDTSSAMVLHIGESFATTVTITPSTTITGDLTVNGGDLLVTPKSAAGPATEGNIYYDSDDDNLYVYANGAYVDLTAGAAGAVTLDDAYNTSAGASTILVDNGDLTLQSNAGATGDIIVNLASTGDFILQDNGADVITFSDSGNLTMASGTLALNGDTVTSDGTLAITGATGLTGTATTGDASLIASAASVVIRGVEAAVDAIFLDANNDAAGGIDMDAGTGGVTVDSTGAISIDGAAASNMSVATDAAAEDLTIAVTGATDSSLLLNSSGTGADAIALNASAGGLDITSNDDMDITLASGAAAEDLTIAVTGATDSSLLLNSSGTGADAIALNASAGGLDITSNDDMDITLASGAAAEDLTIAVTGATDSSLLLNSSGTGADAIALNASAGGLDITAATLDLDIVASTTDVNVTGATNVDLAATAGDVTFASGDDILLNPTDDVTATLAAGGQVVLDAATTDTTGTAGVLDLNVDAGDAAVDGINVDIEAAGAISAGTDITGMEMLLTATDTDADMYGISISTHATAGIADSYVAGLFIDNADDTTGSMPDAILVTSSGVDTGVTDAIDASAANINNALNVGANNITGTDWTILNTTDAAESLTFTSAGGVGYDITGAAGQDFRVTNTGGSVILSASEDATDAINIDATAGGIDIDAVGEAGQDINLTNTGGSIVLSATESAADAIKIESTLGGVDILASGASAGEDIDVTATGSSVNISSTENVTDAITMTASAGGINIAATGAATEDITLVNTGGSVGITATEAAADAITLNASAGGMDISANDDMDITLASGAAAEDLTISVTGATDSSLLLASAGTGVDAIGLTASAGGINVDSALAMDIDTAAGNIVIDSVDGGAGAVVAEDDNEDDLGAAATRWATIYASTLNFENGLTDAASAGGDAANITVALGNSNANDSVTITANTAISDAQWSVSAAGAAELVSVGAVTPGSGKFTTLEATDTLSFTTNGDSMNNAADDTFDFTRDDSGTVTITASDDNAVAALTVLPGGAAALTLGGASTTGITLTTDGTGNAELTLPADSIGDADIDWGTGAGQVSGADITFAEGDMTDSTIVSADIKDATIAGGDLAANIAITTSGTTTSTGTVNFSGAAALRIPAIAEDLTDGADGGASCAAGNSGDIRIDTANDFFGCDGTNWQILN